MTAPCPAPLIIDLFAGAGGLSLGAARAGFRVAAAVELDDQAFAIHKRNFPQCAHLQEDIGKLSGAALLEVAKLRPGSVDGIIGGPPCQGFSTLGRQVVDDPRNLLFGDFFRLVAEIRPRFFLAENVPQILNPKYAAIIEQALDHVREGYHLLEPFRVKASDYGAPTTRTRIFFIGFRKTLDWSLTLNDFLPEKKVQPVKVAEALTGLIKDIDPLWQKEEEGLRPVSCLPNTAFGRHVGGDIPDGVGDPEVIRQWHQGLVYGCLGTNHGAVQIERFANVECGKEDKTTRSRRLSHDGFCHTIRAGTGKDKGSGQALRPIHPSRPRVITPREAARLQGFPDWFIFDPTKWHSFRQIGNSVSPIVAKSLLKVFAKKLQHDLCEV